MSKAKCFQHDTVLSKYFPALITHISHCLLIDSLSCASFWSSVAFTTERNFSELWPLELKSVLNTTFLEWKPSVWWLMNFLLIFFYFVKIERTENKNRCSNWSQVLSSDQKSVIWSNTRTKQWTKQHDINSIKRCCVFSKREFYWRRWLPSLLFSVTYVTSHMHLGHC